jgi:hypothetical protein
LGKKFVFFGIDLKLPIASFFCYCTPRKMRINSRKAEGKTGKQEKRTGERADPQESEHERQTESQNESASS